MLFLCPVLLFLKLTRLSLGCSMPFVHSVSSFTGGRLQDRTQLTPQFSCRRRSKPWGRSSMAQSSNTCAKFAQLTCFPLRSTVEHVIAASTILIITADGSITALGRRTTNSSSIWSFLLSWWQLCTLVLRFLCWLDYTRRKNYLPSTK